MEEETEEWAVQGGEQEKRPIVGMVPGTGRMALALAAHFCRAGLCVLLGSRDPSRAAAAAATLRHRHQFASDSTSTSTGGVAIGLSNLQAASRADIVVWSPRGSLEEREAMLQDLAPHLKSKIIVDVTNIGYCIDQREWGQTSSTLRNQTALGLPARWTTAFKSTFASVLEKAQHGRRMETTIVCGDDIEAVNATIALVETVPSFVAIRGGGLQNTKILELLGPPWLLELDELNAPSLHSSGWHYGI